MTGYSTLTCRKALRLLIAEGVLTPGPSRSARPRVAGPPQAPAERDLAAAARDLATGLAARRRANGLTQPDLARRAAASVTTVGHAETGRLWQSREFWERADAALGARGDLLRLHDAYREASAASPAGGPGAAQAAATTPVPGRPGSRDGPAEQGSAEGRRTQEALPPPGARCPRPAPGQAAPACVMIVWGDGTVTTVRPPEAAVTEARPAELEAPRPEGT